MPLPDEVLRHYNIIISQYPLNELSYYLYNGILDSSTHLQTYGGGNSLDLAVALSKQIGDAQLVGKITQPTQLQSPYGGHMVKVDNYMCDPSSHLIAELREGGSTLIGGVEAVTSKIEANSFTVRLGTSRIVTVYEPVQSLEQEQEKIKHWRKNLLLRENAKGIHILFDYQQVKFIYKNLTFSLEDLDPDLKTFFDSQLGFSPLAAEFLEKYQNLPKGFWWGTSQ